MGMYINVEKYDKPNKVIQIGKDYNIKSHRLFSFDGDKYKVKIWIRRGKNETK